MLLSNTMGGMQKSVRAPLRRAFRPQPLRRAVPVPQAPMRKAAPAPILGPALMGGPSQAPDLAAILQNFVQQQQAAQQRPVQQDLAALRQGLMAARMAGLHNAVSAQPQARPASGPVPGYGLGGHVAY